MHSETVNELNRQALRLACIALDLAELVGQPAGLCMALANVARCHARRGALDEATWYAERGPRLARGLPSVDASVDALCELAELAARQADRCDVGDEWRTANHQRDIARDRAFEAARLALRSADPQWEVTVLLRVSDLFDSLGDHDDAIALQTRAVELMCLGTTAATH
jgi:hypothetical protein